MTKTQRRRRLFAEAVFLHSWGSKEHLWSMTDIAKALGFSERSAYNQASRMMDHPEVREHLASLYSRILHHEKEVPALEKRITALFEDANLATDRWCEKANTQNDESENELMAQVVSSTVQQNTIRSRADDEGKSM